MHVAKAVAMWSRNGTLPMSMRETPYPGQTGKSVWRLACILTSFVPSLAPRPAIRRDSKLEPKFISARPWLGFKR